MASPVVANELRSVADARLADARAVTARATEPYRLDPILFISRLQVWNPWRLRFEPFEVWDHQEEMVRTWVEVYETADGHAIRFHNTITDKSRQMGDTVIAAAACLWVITHWDAPLLMQHQDLAEVADSGPTWDSFFGKIKTMWESQPAEIGKARLRFVGGNNPLIRNVGHAQRFITGEGQTPDPGRGGRYAGAVIDEAARIRFDVQAQAALSRACPDGRLMLSTPKGRGNVFYRLRQSPPVGWTYLNHHWTRHPEYRRGLHVAAFAPDLGETEGAMAVQPDEEMRLTALACPLCVGTMFGRAWSASRAVAHRYPGKLTSDWYEKEIGELTDEQVAEELDIDYTASLSARVYEEFNERTHTVPFIGFDGSLPIELSWDYGLDVTAVGIWQDAPYELRKIGELEISDAKPEEVAQELRAVLRRLGVPPRELVKDQTRVWLAVGDPSGDARDLATARPLTSHYQEEGLSIVSRRAGVNETILAMKRLLLGRPKPVRYSAQTCPLTILHLQQNRWPTDAHGNRRIGATAPLDDEHNHMMRADAYYACWKYPPPVNVEALPEWDTPTGGNAADSIVYEGVSADVIRMDDPL